MIHLKACPRCRGDLTDSSDKDGDYMECLQCGHQVYPKIPTPDPNAKDGWRKKKRKEYYY